MTGPDGAPRPGADERHPVAVARRPLDATVVVPGSKSLTNRAALVAGLARGTSHLKGVLLADDTRDMLRCLADLGAGVEVDESGPAVTIVGVDGRINHGPLEINTGLGGTTTRMVMAAVGLGHGVYEVDAAAPMRGRPMADLFDALVELGAGVESLDAPDHLPVKLTASGLDGGPVSISGARSSQFITALLLVAPYGRQPLDLEIIDGLVSSSYVGLTASVMAAFGVEIDRVDERRLRVPVGGYEASDYVVEGDASSATYPAAAALVAGGRVRIEGVGRSSAQGDLAFFEHLSSMGASVEMGERWIEVAADGPLGPLRADLSDCSDAVPTLAVVAAVAQGESVFDGIGFIRRKETDRIGDVVAELRRCGIEASEESDGMRITGGRPVGAAVDPHGDHRLAMAFSLFGLIAGGLSIADPDCVAKSWPEWWNVLEDLT